MATSAEYPDLPFVAPAAYGRGRDGKSVMYAVVHYTAGSERSTSAEDGAAYDTRRTDGTSTHYFHDADSTVQCVLTPDRANAALHKGNRLGIQHELCGTQQTRAQWLDPASDATLWRAARQVARDCVKYQLPVRRLSVAEVRAAWYSWPNGPRGICGHVDITNAYPEDGGDHTDPGPEFPWDILLPRVADLVNGGTMEEGNLSYQHLIWSVEALRTGSPVLAGGPHVGKPVWAVQAIREAGVAVAAMTKAVDQVDNAVAEQLEATLGELQSVIVAEIGQVDENVVAAIGGQDPAEIAELLRPLLGDKAEAVGHALLNP